jgi:hypothetical protein
MALALPRIQGIPCLAEIIASLYQSDAVGIGCAATGSRNGLPQSRRGRLKPQAGCDDAHHRNGKALACQIDAGVSIPGSFKRSAFNSNMALASVASMAMRDAVGGRLQQHASIGIDDGAVQMVAVLRIARGVPALAAFGCDDDVGKFELAHPGNRDRRSRPMARPAVN